MKLLALTIAIVTSIAVVALLVKAMDYAIPWEQALVGASVFIGWVTLVGWAVDQLRRGR